MLRIFAYIISLTLAFCGILQTHAQEQCPAASSGLVTLALPSKRFPIADTARALATSPHPSFAFVLRAFGTHYSNVTRLISKIRAQKNHPGCLTVIVYGDCGPCRSPRRPYGLFDILAPKLNITRLNQGLEQGNVRLLKAHEKEYTNILRFLPELPGVQYIFMPGLEDNYSRGAYAVLNTLGNQVFAGRADIQIGRNPVSFAPPDMGGPFERHTYAISSLKALSVGDIITGDGDNLCYPGERCSGYGLSAIRNLTLAARDKGVHFLIWRPASSGLPVGIGNKPKLIPPARRTYVIDGINYLRDLLK
jgi:hypothetical protein